MTDATVFLSPKVASLFRWWHSHAREGRLPLRRAFDIAEHTPIIPDLFLVEVLADGQFLMKLEGERVIELFGVNNTGRIITEAAGVGEYGHALAEYYQSIVVEKLCRHFNALGSEERQTGVFTADINEGLVISHEGWEASIYVQGFSAEVKARRK